METSHRIYPGWWSAAGCAYINHWQYVVAIFRQTKTLQIECGIIFRHLLTDANWPVSDYRFYTHKTLYIIGSPPRFPNMSLRIPWKVIICDQMLWVSKPCGFFCFFFATDTIPLPIMLPVLCMWDHTCLSSGRFYTERSVHDINVYTSAT